MSSNFALALIVSVIMLNDAGSVDSLLADTAFEVRLTLVGLNVLLLVANLIKKFSTAKHRAWEGFFIGVNS